MIVRIVPLALVVLLTLVGCADSHEACPDGCPDSSGPDASSPDGSRPDASPPDGARPDAIAPGCLARAPLAHRASASACDRDRPPGNPSEPWGPPLWCVSDADCTEGTNGRCTGNSHDGWRCTYDACFEDSECEGGLSLIHI